MTESVSPGNLPNKSRPVFMMKSIMGDVTWQSLCASERTMDLQVHGMGIYAHEENHADILCIDRYPFINNYLFLSIPKPGRLSYLGDRA